MKFPPETFVPISPVIYNGDPAHSEHAQFVDAYSTWLAAGRRQNSITMLHKPLVGESFNSYPGHTVWVRVPAYTTALGFECLATGRGKVLLQTSGPDPDDAYSVEKVIDGAGTDNHAYSQTLVFKLDPPLETVSSDGLDRALRVTKQSSPRDVCVNFYVIHESGSSLRIHAMKFYPLPYQNSEGAIT